MLDIIDYLKSRAYGLPAEVGEPRHLPPDGFILREGDTFTGYFWTRRVVAGCSTAHECSAWMNRVARLHAGLTEEEKAMAERVIREYEDVSQVPDDELRDLMLRASTSRTEYLELGEADLAETASTILDRMLDELWIRLATRELDGAA